MTIRVLLRGGGDLASGVAARLHRVGIQVVVAELAQPLVVRRLVAFAEAVYAGVAVVEEITARRVEALNDLEAVLDAGEVPVIVDPDLEWLKGINSDVLVDARLMKSPPEIGMQAAEMVIGLGPGFTAGVDCQAVVETQRGHDLGRVIWEGTAAKNTGIPESVSGRGSERVLRAPAAGRIMGRVEIGEKVSAGEQIADVDGAAVLAPFDGIVRGLVHDGLVVKVGMKIGDLDPRGERRYAVTISDKALAVGGGALEAILSNPRMRARL